MLTLRIGGGLNFLYIGGNGGSGGGCGFLGIDTSGPGAWYIGGGARTGFLELGAGGGIVLA